MQQGWIVNMDRDDATMLVVRDQRPVFLFPDGAPCFEVWKWHHLLNRWFVMSYYNDPQLVVQGILFYTPEEVPHGLRDRMVRLETQQGIYR